MKRIKKHKHKIFLGIGTSVFLVLGILGLNSTNQPEAPGASLAIMPAVHDFPLDQTFSIIIVVNAEVPINTVEAMLTFEPDTLEVVNVSREESIMLLWAEEPNFSNTSGTINFAGGLYGGFTSKEGRIITAVFKPKIAGIAKISFEKAKILAHDGKGTDVAKKATGVF